MKQIVVTLIFIIISCESYSQDTVTWKFLSKVKWYSAYVPSLDGVYDLPRFSKEIKEKDGKKITIRGFYVPVDASGKIFALSANPSNMCFFCSGAGPESVMEITVKEGETDLKHIKTDKYIEVKGTLKLNKKDPNHLMYVLNGAELVAVIK